MINTILFEIGTEDLPSNNLDLYEKNIIINIRKNLKKNKIIYKNLKNFITIRRISFILEINEIEVDCIKKIIEKSLYETSFNVNMKWAYKEFCFIRPVKWYILIYNDKIIDHSLFKIKSSNKSIGHKIKNKLIIVNSKNYEKKLKKNHVIVNQKERFIYLEKNLKKLTENLKIKLLIKKKYINKLSNSVEYPKIILCKFKKNFLLLPEKIILTILSDKDCIATVKKNLENKFIIIADTYIKKNIYLNNIKSGYEKCINIKLAESKYFLKNTINFLKNFKLKSLKEVIFHEKIGTIYEKINRLFYLINNEKSIKEKLLIKKITLVSKIDIQTQIISEMPLLKSVISTYKKKYNKKIKNILFNYNKTFNNEIPNKYEAAILTIIDNIDNITNFFLIGEKAKNKKDPLNIRRDTILVIKTIIKNKIKIKIFNLINLIFKYNKNEIENKIKYEIKNFILERLNFQYKNKNIKNIKEKENIYIIYIISTALTRIKFYKFNINIKNLIKRINKIVLNFKNIEKYNRKIEKNLIRKKLIEKIFKEYKILKILKKNNLYFEYFKTFIKFEKKINYFFKNIYILDKNLEIKKNNIKILKILEKLFNEKINFNKIQ